MSRFTATHEGVTFTRNSEHAYTHAVIAAPSPKHYQYDAATHGVPKFASFHKTLKGAQAQVRQLTKVHEPRFMSGGEVIEIAIVPVDA